MVDTYKTEDLVVLVVAKLDIEQGQLITNQLPLEEFSRKEPTFLLEAESGTYRYGGIQRRIGHARTRLEGKIGELVGIYDRIEHADKLRVNASLGTIYVPDPLPEKEPTYAPRMRERPLNEKVSYDSSGRPLTRGGVPEWYYDD